MKHYADYAQLLKSLCLDGRIFLQISMNDGKTLTLAITEDSKNWYLDGQKAFAVNP
jgi:hypothetical protein